MNWQFLALNNALGSLWPIRLLICFILIIPLNGSFSQIRIQPENVSLCEGDTDQDPEWDTESDSVIINDTIFIKVDFNTADRGRIKVYPYNELEQCSRDTGSLFVSVIPKIKSVGKIHGDTSYCSGDESV